MQVCSCSLLSDRFYLLRLSSLISPYLFHAVLHWEMLAMIPYPDPYQSMYQKRRLGALGIEWRPSSVRFAVGPDFNLDQGFQMLPIADLDLLIDPLPEFVDAMDWEPEIEVLSDDTDSEYNVTEECSSGREKGSLSFNSSGDPECSSEDSEVEGTHIDVLRRSKRKKQKVEVNFLFNIYLFLTFSPCSYFI